jgi:hypothetical protein
MWKECIGLYLFRQGAKDVAPFGLARTALLVETPTGMFKCYRHSSKLRAESRWTHRNDYSFRIVPQIRSKLFIKGVAGFPGPWCHAVFPKDEAHLATHRAWLLIVAIRTGSWSRRGCGLRRCRHHLSTIWFGSGWDNRFGAGLGSL